MVRVIFFMLAVVAAFHAEASTVIQGKVELGFDRFELEYYLDTGAGNITFALTSGGKYDWYAFGLHNHDYGAV